VVDIKNLCADEDGCHIKVLMKHKNWNSDRPVRLCGADLYMVQNKPDGGEIKGYARSDCMNNHEASWVLNTTSEATLLDVWSWFTVTNVYNPDDYFCGGTPAKSSSTPATCVQSEPYQSAKSTWRTNSADKDRDSYLVGFRFHRDLTATILIYDR
jgi:hypothetical protein